LGSEKERNDSAYGVSIIEEPRSQLNSSGVVKYSNALPKISLMLSLIAPDSSA